MITLLIGVHGSGKTTYAIEKISKRPTKPIILSYDAIKSAVFPYTAPTEYYYETSAIILNALSTLLKDGKDIVIDSMNITIKSRKEYIKIAKQYGVSIEAIILSTPLEFCVERMGEPSRDKIISHIKNFEIPFPEEGFDNIEVIEYNDGSFKAFEDYKMRGFEIAELMVGFDQKTKYHGYDLFTHCMKCGELYLGKAAYLHDIGKLFTQETNKIGEMSYYGHANIGAYYLMTRCRDITLDDLFYVNFHMKAFEWTSEKTQKKWLDIIGKQKYDNLLRFNDCDRNSRGYIANNVGEV